MEGDQGKKGKDMPKHNWKPSSGSGSDRLTLNKGDKALLLLLAKSPVNVARGFRDCLHCDALIPLGDVEIVNSRGEVRYTISLEMVHMVVYHSDHFHLPEDAIRAIKECPLPKPASL